MISETGQGLSIVFSCKFLKSHDWMTFASWYSIQKNLPDSEVIILCERALSKKQYFGWTSRCKVPFVFFKKSEKSLLEKAKSNGLIKNENILELPAWSMAVRPYRENALGPIDVAEEEVSTFVTIKEKCGAFVLSRWLDKTVVPLKDAKLFLTDRMTTNEHTVIQMWQKANNLYELIN